MRKVLCGLIGISLLFSCGCVTKVSQITYSSEEAEAVIKEKTLSNQNHYQ